MLKKDKTAFFNAHTGQMGIFLVVAIIAVFLVVMGSSIGLFRNTAATQVVLDRRHLQAYYAAKAGINEAIGTRMIPRTNYLSFTDPKNAFYRLSGVTRQNPRRSQECLVWYLSVFYFRGR